MQAGKNKVMTIIVPCRDVTAFRNGAMITEYGMWLLNAPEDKITRIPKSYPRDQVLSDLRKTMPSLDTAKLAADISRKLKRHDMNVWLKSFGIIDQDRNAIYLWNAGLL